MTSAACTGVLYSTLERGPRESEYGTGYSCASLASRDGSRPLAMLVVQDLNEMYGVRPSPHACGAWLVLWYVRIAVFITLHFYLTCVNHDYTQ